MRHSVMSHAALDVADAATTALPCEHAPRQRGPRAVACREAHVDADHGRLEILEQPGSDGERTRHEAGDL